MAKNYVKFPTAFFSIAEWNKPREYSKAEAYLYLLSGETDLSLRHLARQWQWGKTKVERFISELKKYGLWDTKWDTFRDTKQVKQQQVTQSFGTPSGTPNGTHLIENNNYPPILSSTKVESNIVPPKGMESNFLQEVCEEFREVVSEWLSYKRERRESYKSHRSLQAFYSKLTNLSHGNATLAREIINQSMANNWAGIFQLKNQTYDQKSAANQTSDTESRIANVLRAAAEGYARANTPQEWQS